jgi:methylphosphotriester-DNA--protein-cysteine methyltransferase
MAGRNPRPCVCGHGPEQHAPFGGCWHHHPTAAEAWCYAYRPVQRTEPLRARRAIWHTVSCADWPLLTVNEARELAAAVRRRYVRQEDTASGAPR